MKYSNKKYIYGFVAGFATLASLTSCSNDETSLPSNGLATGNLTLQLNVSIPTDTRSYTDNGGSNSGTLNPTGNYESNINSISLYFTKVTDDNDPSKDEIIYQFYDLTTGLTSTESNGVKNYTITKEVPAREIATIFKDRKLRLYLVANTSTQSIADLGAATLSFDGVKAVSGNTTYIPMTNASASGIVNFEGKTADDILAIVAKSTDKKTLDLTGVTDKDGNSLGGFNSIPLERSWARLDYKSGATGTPHLYKLGNTNLYLKVDKMHVVNVSKNAYLFRHTAEATTATGADAGANIDKVVLFGNEGGSIYNWIADTDWGGKTAANTVSCWEQQNNLTSELWQSLNSSTFVNEYTPWCYVSENTLPSVSRMIEGLSTGVAFKVILCKADGTPLNKAELTGVYDMGGPLSCVESNGKLLIKDNKYTEGMELSLEDGAYTLTYYYWIRHNDVSNSVEFTDPMEFAVVRNNVYQMSITSFNDLPRQYNETDPDEAPAPPVKSADFTVKVLVNHWGYYQFSETI